MAMVVVVRGQGDGVSVHRYISKGPIFLVGDSVQFIDPGGRMHSIKQAEVLEIQEQVEE